MDYLLETKALSKNYGRIQSLAGVDRGAYLPLGREFLPLRGAADGAGLREARKKLGAIEPPPFIPRLMTGTMCDKCRRLRGIQ